MSYKMANIISIAKLFIKFYLCNYGSGILIEFLFKKAYEKKYLKNDHNSMVVNSIANIIIHIALSLGSFVAILFI